MMFGYASDETPELMPLPILAGHKLAKRLAAGPQGRRAGLPAPGRQDPGHPSAYVDGRPAALERILISASIARARRPSSATTLGSNVVVPVLPDQLYDADALHASLLVNPTGRFVIGGPVGDAGADGAQDHRRHLRRDGASRRRGVQRQGPLQGRPLGAYAARHVAKNVVAAGLADRCEVQVAYAIGVAHPSR
jgi:S-adenosylmethionine synthetase